MDQRPIVLFLSMKGLPAQDIPGELVGVLSSDAVGYSTVTKYLRETRIPPIPMETLEKSPNTVTDDAILDALQQQPFSSVSELAKLTCIPRSTVHQHLTQTLGFVVKHFRWVPHSLTDPHKSEPCRAGKAIVRRAPFCQTSWLGVCCDP
jgi:hypothetical protein